MPRHCTPVPVGTRYGTMVAVKASPALTAKCQYRCAVCGHRRRVTTTSLRVKVAKTDGATGCVKCDRKVRIAMGKKMPGKPALVVKAGDRFGCMEAVCDLPSRGKKAEYRCVACGDKRIVNANALRQMGDRPCVACNRRAKPIRTDEERIEMRRVWSRRVHKKLTDAMKTLPRRRRYVSGIACKHEKELICVDPGGVEIRRCRECDQVGEPAWYPPRAGKLFPRPRLDRHTDEAVPSFENAVRAMEDAG